MGPHLTDSVSPNHSRPASLRAQMIHRLALISYSCCKIDSTLCLAFIIGHETLGFVMFSRYKRHEFLSLTICSHESTSAPACWSWDSSQRISGISVNNKTLSWSMPHESNSIESFCALGLLCLPPALIRLLSLNSTFDFICFQSIQLLNYHS